MYEPQVGHRVRRTYPDGTIIEGVIAQVENGWGYVEAGFSLYNPEHPEQTELLERPFKLNTAPGAVYGAPEPDNGDLRVVRVGPEDDFPWIGNIGINSDNWFSHKEVEALIRDNGWVEYNLDGSKK